MSASNQRKRPVQAATRLNRDEFGLLEFLARERAMSRSEYIRRLIVSQVDAPMCPCCGRRPLCTDKRPDGRPYTHEDACRMYHYADVECASCERQMLAEADAEDEARDRIEDIKTSLL